MINQEDYPVGFTMELAEHTEILNQFSKFSDMEQLIIAEGARSLKSRDEMRNYVENIRFRG